MHLPVGCWPAEMRAETAAAYVDEPSVDAFLAKVGRCVYGPPVRVAGCLPKWNREKLDSELRRRHNVHLDRDGEYAEDVAGLF